MDEEQLFRLTVIALLGTAFFLAAFSLPQKVAASILIIIIPFQLIETQYATANVLLTWVVFFAMIMRGKGVGLAMLPQILIVLFAYLLSMGVQDPSTYVQHGIYIFNLITAFLVLWIAYDLCFRFEDINRVIHVFIVMNVLVCIYCLFQMLIESGETYEFLGIEELSVMPTVKGNRLSGPFGLPGLIAEYLVIMFFLVIQQVLTTRNAGYRRFLVLLASLNVVLLIATGNRGGFLTLLGGAALFLWFYRNVLGPGKTIRVALGGVVLILAAAAITVNFTQYDALFTRLAETAIEEGVPDTRQKVWPAAWREIQNRPILGHGPRLRFVDDEFGQYLKVHTFIRYPHNLYLFLLFTVGIVGTIAFLIFLATPLFRCWVTSRNLSIDRDMRDLARIGIIIVIVIFVDQLKLEFMRMVLTDYWHFTFALMGVLIGVCDRASAASDHA